MQQCRRMLGILAMIALVLIGLFIFYKINANNWDYVLPKRSKNVLAILLTGGAIAFSSVVFQTITNNRILTPSVIGLDSLYMFIQTLVIFFFGSMHITITNNNVNFVLSVGLMIVFSSILFKTLFRGEGRNIFFLLLVGIIFGTFFSSLSSFMQMLIDPNEFQVIQDKMFASFNSVNTDILILSVIGIALACGYIFKQLKFLDVLSLGRDQAINLGINYERVVKRLLIVIAVLVSISTALVGPITFLGLLVANLAREFLKVYQHKYLLIGSMLISTIALVGGQFIVERVFQFSTPLSVIINFIGGMYFLYLLLKENKAW
ncbi:MULTISPECIES: iron chelate uptake ABC transporter family permease subunit [Brevibacillus]|uniref:iron chelate uptake ABC transporter family permease subunit n=1 Tax=Brevibacillus TaxID=55080 RepID=UPI0002D51558|nr:MULTISPECIES: iron chelate uptake ABC transporter family permease subunit [Brevibacillus]MBA4534800.1 iron chelate uptake ABC transporter family permease subunit [Brevibacillus halotolerans]